MTNFYTFQPVTLQKVTLPSEFFPLDDGITNVSNMFSGFTSSGEPILRERKEEDTEDYSQIYEPQTYYMPENTDVTTNNETLYKIKNKTTTLEVMNGLIKRGFSPHVAAGITGNLYLESGLNLGAYNGNDLGAPGGGLGGWRGENYIALKNFAKKNGKNVKDLDVQLDFLVSTLNLNNDQMNNVRSLLNNSKTPQQASQAWAYYERFAGYDGTTKTALKLKRSKNWNEEQTKEYVRKEHERRGNYAKEAYNIWKNQG